MENVFIVPVLSGTTRIEPPRTIGSGVDKFPFIGSGSRKNKKVLDKTFVGPESSHTKYIGINRSDTSGMSRWCDWSRAIFDLALRIERDRGFGLICDGEPSLRTPAIGVAETEQIKRNHGRRRRGPKPKDGREQKRQHYHGADQCEVLLAQPEHQLVVEIRLLSGPRTITNFNPIFCCSG